MTKLPQTIRRGRHRTVGEKLQILAEYEEATYGMKGAVLRRHAVNRASVAAWAYARDHDEFGPGPSGSRTGKEARTVAMTPKRQSAEIVRLRRALAKSEADRVVLDAALESLGKAHALLEKLAESAEREPLHNACVNKPSPDCTEPE